MKNKTPITILLIVAMVINGLTILSNLLFRDQLRALFMPSRYFGTFNIPYLFFFLESVAIFASFGGLIYAFVLYQKRETKKSFAIIAYAAILRIFVANFFYFFSSYFFGWYFYRSPLIGTFWTIIFSVPLLALMYTDLKNDAALAGNPGQVSIQNLLNLNSPSAPVAPFATNATNAINSTPSFPTSPVAPFPQLSALAPSPDAKWKVQVPGQPEQIIDTPTLQFWASSGAIKSNFVIKDAQSDSTYLASQIPGVFSTKSYVTTLLLSFFLGSLGVDRFYLGHVGLGIAKLFTFGGCGIWALIDFILIAVRKVPDSAGRPLA